jgi:hypothetical protein
MFYRHANIQRTYFLRLFDIQNEHFVELILHVDKAV